MVDLTDDPDAAAERLEAALERIAAYAAQPRPAPDAPQMDTPVSPSVQAPSGQPPAAVAEAVARLDSLIDRLKTALG